MFEKTIEKLQKADSSIAAEDLLQIMKVIYQDVYCSTKKYVGLLPVKNDQKLIDTLQYIAQNYTLSIYDQNKDMIQAAGYSPEMEQLMEQMKAVNSELKDILNRDEILQEKNQELSGKIQEMEAARSRLEEKKTRKAALEAECTRLDAEINELENITLVELEGRKENLTRILQPLTETKAELEEENRTVSQKLVELLKDQNHIMKVMAGDLSGEILSLDEENRVLQTTIESKKQVVDTKTRERSRLSKEVSGRVQQIIDLNMEIRALQDQLLDPEMKKQEQVLKKLQERTSTLEDLRLRLGKVVDDLSSLSGKQDAIGTFHIKLHTNELTHLAELLDKYLKLFREVQEQLNDR